MPGPIISPADAELLKQALADSIGVVTGLGRTELAAFVTLYAPQLAEQGPKALAGDPVAVKNIDHLKAQMFTEVATYGINAQAQGEKAFMAVINVFLRVIVKLILP